MSVVFKSVDAAINEVLQNFVLINQTTADNLEKHRLISQSYIDSLLYDEDKQKFQFFMDGFFQIPSNGDEEVFIILRGKELRGNFNDVFGENLDDKINSGEVLSKEENNGIRDFLKDELEEFKFEYSRYVDDETHKVNLILESLYKDKDPFYVADSKYKNYKGVVLENFLAYLAMKTESPENITDQQMKLYKFYDEFLPSVNVDVKNYLHLSILQDFLDEKLRDLQSKQEATQREGKSITASFDSNIGDKGKLSTIASTGSSTSLNTEPSSHDEEPLKNDTEKKCTPNSF